MATYASLINVWRDFHKLARKAKATSVKLNNMEAGMIYWLGDGKGGGALSKHAAYDLSRYIKDGIKASAFDRDLYPLSQFWVDLKADPYRWGGKKNPHALYPQIGMATGAYRNAITALDFGGGRWGVGIPVWAKTPQFADLEPKTGAGQIDDIYTYALMLEFGRMDDDPPQPPRPILATAFREWSLTRLPSVMRGFIQSFSRAIEALEKEWESLPARMDVYSTKGLISLEKADEQGFSSPDYSSAWEEEREYRVGATERAEQKDAFFRSDTPPGYRPGYGEGDKITYVRKETFTKRPPIKRTGEKFTPKYDWTTLKSRGMLKGARGISVKAVQTLLNVHKKTKKVITVVEEGVTFVRHIDNRFALFYNKTDGVYQDYFLFLERYYGVKWPRGDKKDVSLLPPGVIDSSAARSGDISDGYLHPKQQTKKQLSAYQQLVKKYGSFYDVKKDKY